MSNAAAGPRTILFLCTGNYYRSRLAEILFNQVAQRMNLPWRAISRGLALERGTKNVGPLAVEALTVLKSLQIDDVAACERLPQSVSVAELDCAERVVALHQSEHRPLVEERFPTWSTRIEYWHIEDAPGAAPLIEREVMSLVARLLGGGAAPPPELPREPRRAEAPRKPLTAKVGRETAGRRGKGVTTVFDLSLGEDALRELASTLKQRCGTGGAVKDGRIEIQGDLRDRVAAELEKLGYKVKRAGG